MPRFDQTGPAGQGPMTGRKMGRCTNNGQGKRNDPQGDNPIENSTETFGRGFGFRRGFMGRGRGGMGLQNRFRGGN